MALDKKASTKKTTTLGINRIPEGATVLSVAQALAAFSPNIVEVRLIPTRPECRNALISFDSVEACEKAKEINSVRLDNEDCLVFFAHSSSIPNVNLSASENKIYVKYPAEADFDEISQMFENITIKRPENARNYFFGTCTGMEQQCQLVQALNNKKVEGGVLNVKVAIDRTRKRSTPRPV